MKQYIGARYVPLIFQNPDDNTNNWKAQYAYEPLTIVSYANASYTSKKAVPASVGNPANNPDYWVAIGLYSGQTSENTTAIQKIRQSLANSIENTSIASKAYNMGDYLWYNGKLCIVLTNIATGDNLVLDSNIQYKEIFPISIDDIVVPEDYARKLYFKNKRIMIIGDSISDETVFPPNWVARFREFVEEVNCTVINKSEAGISLSGQNGMASKVANFTETDIDIILIEVGTNDCNSQAIIGQNTDSSLNTFMGALNSLNNSIVSKWPTAQVFYITPPKCALTHSTSAIAEQYLPRCMYRCAIWLQSNRFNWNIIDAECGLPQFNIINSTIKTLFSDGIHPNATYAPIMMNYIISQIISGGTTTIGMTSTIYNLQDKDMLDTDDFENATGQFQFYSDGRIKITANATAKKAGLSTIIKNIPAQLQPFFPGSATNYGAVVNGNVKTFLLLGDHISVYTDAIGNTVSITYISDLAFTRMLDSNDISR